MTPSATTVSSSTGPTLDPVPTTAPSGTPPPAANSSPSTSVQGGGSTSRTTTATVTKTTKPMSTAKKAVRMTILEDANFTSLAPGHVATIHPE